MGESRIILDVRPERIIDILKQAEEVKLFGDYVSFIIVDLDTHTLGFEEISAAGTNITALRLINTHSDEHQVIANWINTRASKGTLHPGIKGSSSLRVLVLQCRI